MEQAAISAFSEALKASEKLKGMAFPEIRAIQRPEDKLVYFCTANGNGPAKVFGTVYFQSLLPLVRLTYLENEEGGKMYIFSFFKKTTA